MGSFESWLKIFKRIKFIFRSVSARTKFNGFTAICSGLTGGLPLVTVIGSVVVAKLN